MDTTWYYRSTFNSCSDTTNAGGKASCVRDITGAPARYTVPIEVRFLRGGKVIATAHTGFTPH